MAYIGLRTGIERFANAGMWYPNVESREPKDIDGHIGELLA